MIMDYHKLVNNIYHVKVLELWESSGGTILMKFVFLDGEAKGEVFSVPVMIEKK